MKIVISPDSFKGSLSAAKAADAIEKGFVNACTGKTPFEIIKCPIADGGEGTLDALVKPENIIKTPVNAPNMNKITARFGFVKDTAIIEMAEAAGLTLIPESRRDILSATTYGVGEMILSALEHGYKKIMLTVGGSGTNDGGCGMFASLGAEFRDMNGRDFIPTGGTLKNIVEIDISKLDKRLNDCSFTIACDVTNPLIGEMGATKIYSRQKGADDSAVKLMEKGMINYAEILYKKSGKNVALIPGCGAGGGICAPLLAFLNAEIKSGISAVLSSLNYNKILKGADFVITGEGKIDAQSAYGKAISGVSKAAMSMGIPVYCFVGKIGEGAEIMTKCGVCGIYALCDIAESCQDSIDNAEALLEKIAFTFAKEKFQI